MTWNVLAKQAKQMIYRKQCMELQPSYHQMLLSFPRWFFQFLTWWNMWWWQSKPHFQPSFAACAMFSFHLQKFFFETDRRLTDSPSGSQGFGLMTNHLVAPTKTLLNLVLRQMLLISAHVVLFLHGVMKTH